MQSTFRYASFADAPDSTHNLVVSLVPPGSRVLEFGCATGYMSEVLKSKLGCSVTGIEIAEDAAELAREHCDRVIVGDAEHLDYTELFGDQQFDVIMFADVLEHMQYPESVLRKMTPLLASNGMIVASIPNVAHGSVRLALLSGEFRYRTSGLLDDTHIRFFTRTNVQNMFESSGFLVSRWLRKHIDIGSTEIGISAGQVPPELWRQLSEDPEATTYQFVVRAVPTESAAAVNEIRTDLAESEDTIKELRRILAERDEKIAEQTERILGQQRTYDEDITRRDEHIAHLDSEVKRLGEVERTMVERIAHIAHLEREIQKVMPLYGEIAQRDVHITKLEQEILQGTLTQREALDRAEHARLTMQREVEELRSGVQRLQEEVRLRDSVIAEVRRDLEQRTGAVAALQKELAKIRQSRTWQVAQGYWKLKKNLPLR